MQQPTLPIIGNTTTITVAGISGVPAKIDTGAEFASLWVSDLVMTSDNQLEFCLFAPGSEFYTGEKLLAKEFWARSVRNSAGDEEIRYRVKLPITLEGREIIADFTLSDRSRNNFPVLIGRQVLAGEFLVDVSLPDETTLLESSTQPSETPTDIIGNSALITVMNIPDVPAKIDTGARSSAIWASDIRLAPDNQLEFRLFAPGSEFYTGEKLVMSDFRVRRVRNSTGDEEDRYRVPLSIVMGGRNIKAKFTLSDRSRGTFPVLIGHRTLFGKFLVDVSQLEVPYPEKEGEAELNAELAADPQKFHQKYM